jgi:hypothetical protein
VWGGTAPTAHAQPQQRAPTEGPAPAELDAFAAPADAPDAGSASAEEQPAEDAAAVQGTVVFISPAESDQLDAAGLRDALLAQFALVDATLAFAEPDPQAHDLASQIAHARDLAKQRDAVAVFWIAADDSGRWLLHMMDPVGDRLAMRTVEADAEALDAAVEAVAVIARESTRALLAGEEVEAQPIPTPAPAAAAEPAPPRRGKLPPPRYVTRLALGYEGSEFARGELQSGLAIQVSVRAPSQLYGGVAITGTPPIEVDNRLVFEVSRLPIRALGGYEHPLGPARLAAELALGLDIQTRETASEQPGVPLDVVTVSPAQDNTRLVWVVSPRVRAELSLVPPVGLYALLGLDILLNHFDYVSKPATNVKLLEPHPVRVLFGVGLAFYP